MQERLFDLGQGQSDPGRDPYEGERGTARRIATGYGIPVEEAFDLLLGYGSEDAVRRTLKQRWWRGEIERLDEAAV